MSDSPHSSHKGFLRRGGVFLALNFAYSVTELGFNGVSARLPIGMYGTFWALLKVFFIVTAPLMAFQLVVSKEVAAFTIRGETGLRRAFIEKTGAGIMALAAVIVIAGFLCSGLIAGLLGIGSRLPVIFLFSAILVYFPIPILYGIIQGLKKFYTLGFVQIVWGGGRLVLALIAVMVFGAGIKTLFAVIIISILLTEIIACFPARDILNTPRSPLPSEKMWRAYGLVVPIIASFFLVTMLKNADLVLAKRFFASGEIDAYACAVLVGSGFFTLSGIFMVMFPMVSEETARGGNPVVFLVKSCAAIIVLSSIGIVVAWLVPGLVMRIITIGKVIPGAPELIRYIGIAVTPVSLVFTMSNYLLARHTWRFIFILAGGAALQIVLILLFHRTPLQLLSGVAAANVVTCCAMTVYVVIYHRNSSASFDHAG